MIIVYIHGANATSESFTYIREHIDHQDMVINYYSADGFETNLKAMKATLEPLDRIFFVGHSLGGIYALHLANAFPEKTAGGVTLSTPYGGSREADYAKYFLPFNQLIHDIRPHSGPIAKVKDLVLPPIWANVVTTRSTSLWMREPNDGVVTHQSMRARKDMELLDLDLNHYEVVVSNKTVDIIKNKLSNAR